MSIWTAVVVPAYNHSYNPTFRVTHCEFEASLSYRLRPCLKRPGSSAGTLLREGHSGVPWLSGLQSQESSKARQRDEESTWKGTGNLEIQSSMGISHMRGTRNHVGMSWAETREPGTVKVFSTNLYPCSPQDLLWANTSIPPWSQELPTARPFCFCWKEVPL